LMCKTRWAAQISPAAAPTSSSVESPTADASHPASSSTPAVARTSASTSAVSKQASSLALFGTRVFVGISRDNTLEYWVNRYRHPIPTNRIPNPLCRGRLWGENTLRFGVMWR
jgi:hypothetical protein